MTHRSATSAPTDRTDSDILVVGGGIGGLAAARALRELGATVTLLEQAPEFGEVGAGLQLGPNATRLLDRWGLLARVVDLGVRPANLIFRDALTGQELTRQPLGRDFHDRYGAPYVVVHRSDLHAIICTAAAEAGVTLITDARVEEFSDDHDRAEVRTADGRRFGANLVIGADGLTSRLRTLINHDQPVASGYVAYRGTCSMEQAGLTEDLRDVIAWVGPSCHLVQYPLRQGAMLNQVAVFRSAAAGRGDPVGPDELDRAYARCHPALRSTLGSLWRERYWPMSDREPITTWSTGRLVLTGDAAHPMLQYLAQGACQALEDADALQRAAAEYVFAGARPERTGWEAAIKTFVAERAPRTARVQRTARLWGESWHVDGIGRLLRNELFSRRDLTDYRYTDWLYGRPATEPNGSKEPLDA